MKKTIAFAVSLILLVSCFSTYTAAVTTSKISAINKAVKVVNTVIQDFYKNVDLNNQNSISQYCTNDIALYLEDKANTHQYVSELYGIQKENYLVTSILLNDPMITTDGKVYFEFQVIRTFNYVNCDLDTTISEIVKIIFDTSTGKILDFYVPYNYYDETVRGFDTISAESTLAAYSLKNDTESRQQALKNDIYNVYQDFITPSTNHVIQQNRSVDMLDFNAIVVWARANFNKTLPTSGSSTISYVDFFDGNGNFDCTNFVSHALLAGGAKMYDTGGSGICSTGWYYRTSGNRSTSWSSVNSLYTYLSTNRQSNTLGAVCLEYDNSGINWTLGQILQFGVAGSSSFGHSTIITGSEYREGDGYQALVTGRTGPGVANNNSNAADVYPNGTRRILSPFNWK